VRPIAGAKIGTITHAGPILSALKYEITEWERIYVAHIVPKPLAGAKEKVRGSKIVDG
jgi:hypothetical protein